MYILKYPKEMDKKIKVFGAALDVLDDPLKVLTKHSYLNRKLNRMAKKEDDCKDPYEAFLKYSEILQEERFLKMGKFEIESWITPKPNLSDYGLISPTKYHEFVNRGGLEEYSIKLETFIKEEILPDIPFMIGVDHSLSGGVLKALSKQYGAQNILVIVFDAHFDGIPTDVALNFAKYAQENKEILNPIFGQNLDVITSNLQLKDLYTYSSFLSYLVEDQIIQPDNLIIFGCQDYPTESLCSIEEKRVREYVDSYLSYETKGVTFIPAEIESSLMIKKLKQKLDKREPPYIYISLDVDVGAVKAGILAARFMNCIGIDQEIILEAVRTIKTFMKNKDYNLIGLDIVEIETHMLKKELKKSQRRDKTIELVEEFLSILFEK